MFISPRVDPMIDKYTNGEYASDLARNESITSENDRYKYLLKITERATENITEIILITEEEARNYATFMRRVRDKRQQASKDLELLEKNQKVVREFMRQATYLD